MNKIKVLWIEEQTGSTLIERKEYLLSDPIIKLDVRETYEESKEIIENSGLEYNVIIVDILIPRNNTDTELKPLGLLLIKDIRKMGKIDLTGIYTNEVWDALYPKIGNFPKDRFMQKNRCRSSRMFKTFILNIANGKGKKYE